MTSHFPAIALISTLLAAASLAAVNPDTAPTVAATIEKAKSGKKDIVLFFYGPDWDARGTALCDGAWKQSHLSLSNLATAAIPIFDLNDTEAKKKLTEQNKPFKFKIWNYPAVAYCDFRGDVILVREGLPATTTPDNFKQFAQLAKKLREKRDALFKQAEGAKDLEKARLLGQALTALSMDVANTYKDTINQIRKLDPDNKTGYADIFNFSHSGIVEPIAKDKPKAGSDEFKKQEERLNTLLKNPVRPNTQKQAILGAKYALYHYAELYDKADAALRELIRLDPKSHYGIGAKTILDKQIARPKK